MFQKERRPTLLLSFLSYCNQYDDSDRRDIEEEAPTAKKMNKKEKRKDVSCSSTLFTLFFNPCCEG